MRNGYPLIDLHRHLEGCVRPQTVLELGQQHQLPLPAWTLEELLPHIQVTSPVAGLVAYLTKFELMQWSMVNEEAIRRITFECFEDAAREDIDYLELRFSPYFMAEKHSLDMDAVVEAVCDGLEEARASLDIRANLIGIMSRTYGPEICWQELKAFLRGRERGVVAADLAGDEVGFPGALFVDHFRHAREEGMRITVHAGEAGTAGDVRHAIEELGAERVGHAVRAIDDPAVMDLIAERGVAIESCPTSNVHTGVVPTYAIHPLVSYVQQGLLATLNTDNCTLSVIDLPFEFNVMANETILTEDDLGRLQRNALAVAFVSDDERAALLEGSQSG